DPSRGSSGCGLGADQAAEHRRAAAGILQVPGERVPVLAVGSEQGADLLGLRGRAQIGVEHRTANRAAGTLEDEVLHLAGQAQRPTSMAGGRTWTMALRAARTQSAGSCSQPPSGVWWRGESALAVARLRPSRSIRAAFAEVVPRSRERRAGMGSGYAAVPAPPRSVYASPPAARCVPSSSPLIEGS